MKPSSKTLLILASLAFVLSQAWLASLVHALRPNLLALQLTFSAERYWEILGLWGDAGRAAYHRHFAFDFAHIAVFSFFGYVVARHGGLFAADERRVENRVAAILPLAGLFDLGENLLQLGLLNGPPGGGSAEVLLSALCSTIKWALAVVFMWTIARRVLIRLFRAGRSSH